MLKTQPIYQNTRMSQKLDYQTVRQCSETICSPLQVEDYVVQSMPDVSPPKWHLAHVTWFFETFLLVPHLNGYEVFHPKYNYLFNSYYEAVGDRHPRHQRGLLTRPTVEEIYQYRAYVDEAMGGLIRMKGDRPDITELIQLGLHHEQQHQELLLMDIKHIFSVNPLYPAYQTPSYHKEDSSSTSVQSSSRDRAQGFSLAGGIKTIGHQGEGFAFDNETPHHQVLLQNCVLEKELVKNSEYLAFMNDGGYQKPELWLSDGWHTLQTRQWEAPLYWRQVAGEWWEMTLQGLRPMKGNEPVCHVSYFEADAFARWQGKRLPTEAEWEVVAQQQPIQGNFLETGALHPQPASGKTSKTQLFGDVWEWTQSPYINYPGYQQPEGAIGEYNGKFMCNQMVLRGGCCVTSGNHIRPSYRNFFPPHSRWQFSGIRLCSDG